MKLGLQGDDVLADGAVPRARITENEGMHPGLAKPPL